MSENALEALVCFNDEMKTLASNAYQLQELLGAAINENKTLTKWMTDLEDATLESEAGVHQMCKTLQRSIVDKYKE